MENIRELKNFKDHILRVTAANGMIRAFFATTKNTVNTAVDTHQTSAVMSAALGRLLTAGSIMGTMLKNDRDLITLMIKGDGPGVGVLVTADNKGHVKGYADNPYADLANKENGKLDVGGALGNGTLTVIKDMGKGDPHNGTVELQTGEVADDITYYFAQSEQTPSVVSLGVLVDTDYTIKQAGGFIIQLMPGATDDVIDYLEQKIDGIDSITNLYEQGYTPESLAEFLFADIGYEKLERIPVSFVCDCTRERVEKALLSVGEKELTEIRDEDKTTTLSCQFCNKQYKFDEDDLDELIEKSKK